MDLSGESPLPSTSDSVSGLHTPELPSTGDGKPTAMMATDMGKDDVVAKLLKLSDDIVDATGEWDRDYSDTDSDPPGIVTSGVHGWRRPALMAARRQQARYELAAAEKAALRELPRPRVLSCPGHRRTKQKLLWVLRHGADRLRVPLRSDGFISISDLVLSGQFPGMTVHTMVMLVKTSGAMELLEIGGHPYVRALSGHTAPGVTPPKLVFTQEELPDRLVYVTSSWLVKDILKYGIGQLRARAVLLFMEVPVMASLATTVIMYLDVRRMISRDVMLVHAGAGIVSCGGNVNGLIPPSCIVLVKKEVTGRQLFPRFLKAPVRSTDVGSLAFPMRPLGRFDRFLWAAFADHKVDVQMRVDQFNQLSIMPPEILETFPRDRTPVLQPSPVSLIYDDGSVRRHVRQCVLRLEIADFVFEESFMVDDKHRHATLGSDFCNRHRISVGGAGEPFTIDYARTTIPTFTLESARTSIPVRCGEVVHIPTQAAAEVITQAASARRTGRPQLFLPSWEMNRGGRLKIPFMLFDSRDRQPRVLVVNETETTVKLEAGQRLGSLVDADDIKPPTPCTGGRRYGINVAAELFAMGWTDEDRRYIPQPFRAKLVRSWHGSFHLFLDYRMLDRRMKLVQPKVFPSLAGALLCWRRRRRELMGDRKSVGRLDDVIELQDVEWLQEDLQ